MKVLAWKLKKETAQQTFHKIKDPLTKVQTKLKEIQAAFETFYTTLYTKKKKKQDAPQLRDSFLNSRELPVLNEEKSKIMIEDITEKERKK